MQRLAFFCLLFALSVSSETVCDDECVAKSCPDVPKGTCCSACETECGKIACEPVVCDKPGQFLVKSGCCSTCQDCSALECVQKSFDCAKGYVFQRDSCCSGTCVPSVDFCATVLCPAVRCESGSRLVTAPDSCCGTCEKLDCSNVLCFVAVNRTCEINQVFVQDDCCSGHCELDCTTVKCPTTLDCPDSEILVQKGCCAACEPKPSCDPPPPCAFPECESKETYIPDGQCCPQCVPVGTCKGVVCNPIKCAPGAESYVPEDGCCPTCRFVDCSKVDCKITDSASCPEGTIGVKEGCCMECEPLPDCTTVLCAQVACGLDEVAYYAPGQCCPSCRKIECGKILCAPVDCKIGGYVPMITPDSPCCPVCFPATTCDAKCESLSCSEGTRPSFAPGACCPTCEKVTPCDLVKCFAVPDCPEGTILVKTDTNCCGYCQKIDDCSKVACPAIACAPGFKASVSDGSCCPSCTGKIDCSLVDCAPLACPLGSLPVNVPGECCASCATVKDCSLIQPKCAECPSGFSAVKALDGDCCSLCLPPLDCATVTCPPKPECGDGSKLVIRDGECCATCVRVQVLDECMQIKCEACPEHSVAVKVDGKCCPRCDYVDPCTYSLCAEPSCPKEVQIKRRGSCCWQCPLCEVDTKRKCTDNDDQVCRPGHFRGKDCADAVPDTEREEAVVKIKVDSSVSIDGIIRKLTKDGSVLGTQYVDIKIETSEKGETVVTITISAEKGDSTVNVKDAAYQLQQNAQAEQYQIVDDSSEPGLTANSAATFVTSLSLVAFVLNKL